MTPELTGYDEALLTPEELAKWLQIKPSTIYKWTSSGYIPYVKLGGKVRGSVRFMRSKIIRWLQQRSKPGRSTYKLDVEGLME